MSREQKLEQIIDKIFESTLPSSEKVVLAFNAVDHYELGILLKISYWISRVATQEALWQKHKTT